jgi:uncharacterized membrane protein
MQEQDDERVEEPAPVPADHIADVAARLTRDLQETGHGAHVGVVDHVVANVLTYVHDAEWFTIRVVEDVQQAMHDCFVDTVWPQCPRHASHPLWLHDGVWMCEKDGVAIAALGALPRVADSSAGVAGGPSTR